MPEQKLDAVLEGLLGSNIHISYVSSAGEENEVFGTLLEVNTDIIELKDNLSGNSVWVNRHGSVLTTLRLLKKRRKTKRDKRRR